MTDLTVLLDAIEAEYPVDDHLTNGELNYREGILHVIAWIRDALADAEAHDTEVA